MPEDGAKGVIATQGGAVGGWSLYAREGMLKYCYNFVGLEHAYVGVVIMLVLVALLMMVVLVVIGGEPRQRAVHQAYA